MTNTAEQIDFEEVPSGGIGDFVMSDDDFATLEKQNSRQEFGDNGIAEFEDIASRMASYGRFGDDRVVHVETGELIVPRKLIDQSPALKESIFQHLREAGIEDPERYVVGSAENSFNPETGLMEFGFFSKIFKGIKKHFKKVGKILKKAAPIILAIAMPYALPALGFAIAPAYAAALGSGIGTLIQGGNIKDAFKAAALTAVTAGALGGAKGAMTEGSSFSEGFSGAFTAPDLAGQAAANLAETPLTDLSKTTAEIDAATSVGSLDTATAPGTLAGNTIGPAEMASIDAEIAAQQATAAGVPTAGVPTAAEVAAAEQQFLGAPAADRAFDYSTTPLSDSTLLERGAGLDNFGRPLGMTQAEIDSYLSTGKLSSSGVPAALVSDGPKAALDTTLKTAGNAGAKSSYFDTFKDYMFRGGDSQLTIDAAQATAKSNAIKNYLAEATLSGGKEYAASAAVQAGAKAAGESAFKAAGTSMLAKYGPSALALTGIGAAGGFFKTEPQEQVGIVPRDLQGNMITGADLIDANPEKYQIFSDGNFSRNYIPDYSQTLVASTNPGTVYGETGGQVFPRRNGGIMMDEGVPNEDSVRAMLMPGEFVMTTNAVRGAGNGNVDQGIKNMYEVMRGLERRGGAMS